MQSKSPNNAYMSSNSLVSIPTPFLTNSNFVKYERGLLAERRRQHYKQKGREIKERQEERELAQCTFKPKINNYRPVKHHDHECSRSCSKKFKPTKRYFRDGSMSNKKVTDHPDIKGYDRTVSRMRKALVQKYTKNHIAQK